MKKKLISTPRKWYLIGVGILGFFLVIWILFALLKENYLNNLIEDLAKNAFFAVMGSLVVSFLIDLGNTARDNVIQEGAFKQLRATLDSMYTITSEIAFVLNTAFTIDKSGKIEIDNYQNQIFYFKNKKVISYLTLKDIASLKKRLAPFIGVTISSNSYLHIEQELRDAIESLALDKFYSIAQLNEEVIASNIVLWSLRKEITKLNYIVRTFEKYLGRKTRYAFLSDDEAQKYHQERMEYKHNHKDEFDNMYLLLNKNTER